MEKFKTMIWVAAVMFLSSWGVFLLEVLMPEVMIAMKPFDYAMPWLIAAVCGIGVCWGGSVLKYSLPKFLLTAAAWGLMQLLVLYMIVPLLEMHVTYVDSNPERLQRVGELYRLFRFGNGIVPPALIAVWGVISIFRKKPEKEKG